MLQVLEDIISNRIGQTRAGYLQVRAFVAFFGTVLEPDMPVGLRRVSKSEYRRNIRQSSAVVGQPVNRRVERFGILQPQHLINTIGIFFRVASEFDAIPVGRFVSAVLDLGGADAAIDNDKILRGVEHAGVSVVCFFTIIYSVRVIFFR